MLEERQRKSRFFDSLRPQRRKAKLRSPLWLRLLPDVTVLIEAATAKEPVMHHAQTEEIDGHNKDDQEQNFAHSNPR